MTYGEGFAQFVGKKLAASGLASLGKINGKILGEYADEYQSAFAAARRRKKPVKKGTGPAFQIPPTVEMVREFHAAKGYTFNVEKFMAHYTANGWMVGKNRMVNWCAACVTWQGDAPKKPVPGASSKPVFNAIAEPPDWKTLLKDDPEESQMIDRAWAGMLPFYQDRIARKCARLVP